MSLDYFRIFLKTLELKPAQKYHLYLLACWSLRVVLHTLLHVYALRSTLSIAQPLPLVERPRQGTAESVICDEEALLAEAEMVGTRGANQGLHLGCSSLITSLSACFGSHCED